MAGCHVELFSAAVIRRLQRLSRGVPRLVNILCDRALLGAYVQGKHRIDRATLDRAAREVAGRSPREAIPWRALALAGGVCLLAAAVWFAFAGRRPVEPVAPPPPAPAAAPAVQAVPAAPAPLPVAPVAPAPSVPLPSPVPAVAPPSATAPAAGPAPAPIARQAPARPAPAVSAAPAADAAPAAGSAIALSLQALMREPGSQREEEAWRWLYRIWGIRAREGEGGCTQALVHGLGCLRGAGGLGQLRVLDRPAIVRVHDGAGEPRWLVLERLRGDEATLSVGGARTTVAAAALEGFGIREFALLWRPPAQTGGALAAGDEGAGVAWLAQRLDAFLGAAGGGEAKVFDAALADRVREYQRDRGLAVDGIAGPAVLLSLDVEPGPGTPTLGTRGEGR